jgi:hypothetical protein
MNWPGQFRLALAGFWPISWAWEFGKSLRETEQCRTAHTDERDLVKSCFIHTFTLLTIFTSSQL